MGQVRFFRKDGFEVSRGIKMDHVYPKHWHAETLICSIDAGGSELFYRGAWHQTPAGSVFLIPPGEIHANRGPCDHHNLYVNDDGLGVWKDPVLRHSRVRNALLRHCRTIMEPSTNLETDTAWMELRAAVRGDRPPCIGHENGPLHRVREYLHENFEANPSLDSLASLARLSPFHLTRAFRNAFGIPPHAYLIQQRLARARWLLRQGSPPSITAASTGFADQSHLTKHFRKAYGVTPGVYARGKIVQDGPHG